MLYKVIPVLGSRERSELLRWVSSPVFNQRPEVINLCTYLCAQPFRDADDPVPVPILDKIAAYEAAFGPFPPDRVPVTALLPKEDATLRHTASYLFDCVRRWLAWREGRDNRLENGILLCRSLRRRGLHDLSNREFQKVTTPAAHRIQSTEYHRLQYQLQLEQWEMRHEAGDLGAVCRSFSCYVALSTLRHGCAALDKSGRGLALQTIDYLPETLVAIESGRHIDVPAIQIYYHCFRLMEQSAEAHFWALKQQLMEHRALFPSEEIRDVWMVAINYCIRRVNGGERNWVKEAFGLYRTGVETGIVLNHGRLTKQTYQNIMLLAIASDEWDWARQFLEDYRHTLAVGERYNAYNFNRALWHFRKNEYPEAQEILRRVEFRDVQYNLDARRILVRMYYDQGEYEALESLLHSFRIYLQRHRNIGYHRELNLHFVRAVSRLLQLHAGDTDAVRQFCAKIRSEQYIAEREWLLEKAGGLSTDLMTRSV